MRTYFSKNGIEFESRTDKKSSTILKMCYAGIYRKGHEDYKAKKETIANNLTYKDNRVALKHNDGVNEWFINNSKGLEHGFNLNKRLANKGLLHLTLNVLKA